MLQQDLLQVLRDIRRNFIKRKPHQFLLRHADDFRLALGEPVFVRGGGVGGFLRHVQVDDAGIGPFRTVHGRCTQAHHQPEHAG